MFNTVQIIFVLTDFVGIKILLVLLVIERETTKSLTMSVDVSVSPFMSIFPSCVLNLF